VIENLYYVLIELQCTWYVREKVTLVITGAVEAYMYHVRSSCITFVIQTLRHRRPRSTLKI
jgi:hypothetical protein